MVPLDGEGHRQGGRAGRWLRCWQGRAGGEDGALCLAPRAEATAGRGQCSEEELSSAQNWSPWGVDSLERGQGWKEGLESRLGSG